MAAVSFLAGILLLVRFFGLSICFGEVHKKRQSLALPAYILEREKENAYPHGKFADFLAGQFDKRMRFVLSVAGFSIQTFYCARNWHRAFRISAEKNPLLEYR